MSDEKCPHLDFAASVDVARLTTPDGEKVTGFMADVRIVCAKCNLPMRFIGLPYGLDLNGAACSPDGTEGRFAIAPKGEVVSMVDPDAVGGFTARRVR